MFKNLFRSKDPDSPRYRLAKAKELHGHAIRYVTERKNDNDADLLSGDGVVLTGPDAEHGGVLRTVTVHYVYYR